jgi:hypothetical protein
MRKILCCALGVAMAVLGWSAQNPAPARKPPVKKSGTKSATAAPHKSAGTSKTAAAHKAGTVPGKSASAGKAGPARTATSGKTASAASARNSAARRGKKGASASARRPATTWRNRQLAPTPDRYREIQSALAAKGYLHPEDATGAWNQGSADALKHFQADQNIEANGKITAMSLIALGLGPKRETAATKPPETPPAPAAAPRQPR